MENMGKKLHAFNDASVTFSNVSSLWKKCFELNEVSMFLELFSLSWQVFETFQKNIKTIFCCLY